MHDLCKCKLTPFVALQVSNLLDLMEGEPLKVRWYSLKASYVIWKDGYLVSQYLWGVLIPPLAKEVYILPFEVIIEEVTKHAVVVSSSNLLSSLLGLVF